MQDIIFWLKNYLFRRYAIQQYKEALFNSVLEKEKLEALNWKKRKNIVEYSYRTIPFYKEYYDSKGFHPNQLVTESDWDKVPVLEKSMVRNNLEKIKKPNVSPGEYGVSTTGGSTGTPLKIYTDKSFCIEILGWRAFRLWRISPAANVGIIHRRVPKTKWSQFKNRFLWWPTYRAYLDASSVEEDDIKKFVDKIMIRKIVWLQGYVGGLEKVAEYILDHDIKIYNLKLVWSTSAPLYPNVRRKLEQAFNCKVMNQYGCCEVANIAIQCPDNEFLYINYDYVHVDVVDSRNKIIENKEGDILVTNLYSHVFPLIKYRLGDRGERISEQGSDNINLPLMKEVKGRISDAVYTPDGVYVDGCYLTTLFDNYSDIINQFQVYQRLDYSLIIRVRVNKVGEETNLILDKIKHEIEKNVKYKIPIEIEIVNNINDDNGKIRYIISEISLAKLRKISK